MATATTDTRTPEQIAAQRARAQAAVAAGTVTDAQRAQWAAAAGGSGAGTSGGGTELTPEQIRRRARRAAAAGATTAAPESGVTQTSLADNAKEWAQDTLQGDISSNPMYAELSDQQYADPTTNPYIQSMVESLKGEVKEDWLGNMAALTESAEQGGRMGGDYYAAMRTRAGEEADEALTGGIAQLYSGAYENERNRRAGIFSQIAGLQDSAARLPIEFGNLGANQLGARASMVGARASMLGSKASMVGANASMISAQGNLALGQGQLGLARNEFNFNKQMTLANGQQDALNDYFGLLAGIGGMGGTQTGSGQYAPTSNPWVAGLLGGTGSLASSYGAGMFGQQQPAPSGNK